MELKKLIKMANIIKEKYDNKDIQVRFINNDVLIIIDKKTSFTFNDDVDMLYQHLKTTQSAIKSTEERLKRLETQEDFLLSMLEALETS